jgi:hypothetical protein
VCTKTRHPLPHLSPSYERTTVNLPQRSSRVNAAFLNLFSRNTVNPNCSSTRRRFSIVGSDSFGESDSVCESSLRLCRVCDRSHRPPTLFSSTQAEGLPHFRHDPPEILHPEVEQLASRWPFDPPEVTSLSFDQYLQLSPQERARQDDLYFQQLMNPQHLAFLAGLLRTSIRPARRSSDCRLARKIRSRKASSTRHDRKSPCWVPHIKG